MTREEFFEKFPVRLNAQQREAVCAPEQSVLLLAVPGSGKTTVLVARLGYMILCRGIQPEQMLVLTYTVAAAKEMAERFARFFAWADLKSIPEFRTINGVCAKVIYHYGRRVGKTPFTLLSDEKLQRKRLTQICQTLTGEYPTEGEVKDVAARITYIKNMMLSKEEQKTYLEKQGGEAGELPVADIYTRYCADLRQNSLMDYDDQMTYAYSILRSSPEMLSLLQKAYPYICVDEAQDTSKIQHTIISLLAGKQGNLFMVGDEDQSIYGFRAAYPKALLDFSTDHPGARVLLMEENFRSTAQIVETADRFIQKNHFRHKKKMNASRRAGAEIRKISVSGRYAQYSYLAKAVSDCPKDTAVLYRDNESAVVLIDLLRRAGTPFRFQRTELTFFTSRIVTDIKSILRFALDPGDTESFLHIYYKLKLYLTKPKAVLACEVAAARKRPVLDAILEAVDVPQTVSRAVRDMRFSLKGLLKDSAVEALDRIRDEMGYGDYLRRNEISDNKLQILRMLAYKEASPQSFLARLEELEKGLASFSDPKANLILSTVHSSKGLEYASVYLIDVKDGIFPDAVPKRWDTASQSEKEEYEEQRRLFYVAVTRAKDRLTVFDISQKSSFIEELMPSGKENTYKESRAPQKDHAQKAALQYAVFQEKIGEGCLVTHKTFGDGVITAVDDEKGEATIRFFEDRPGPVGQRIRKDEEKRFRLRSLCEKDLLRIKTI